MSRLETFYRCIFLLGFICVVSACQNKSQTQVKTGAPDPDDTGETVSVTLYTTRTELFMEHPPLVTGKKVAFIVHLTILGKSFIPIRQGTLHFDFMQNNRAVFTITVHKLLREGIFKPIGRVPAAGTYHLRLRLKTPKVQDTIIVRKTIVYPSVEAARKANPKQPEDFKEVSFLKEQQWQIPFTTTLVKRKKLNQGLLLTGVSRAQPDSYTLLTAPISGKIARITRGAEVGKNLKKGQRLLFIEPMLLANTSLPEINQAISLARSSLQLSKIELKRFQRMMRVRAIPRDRITQAKYRIEQYKAQLKAALARRKLFFRSRRQNTIRQHAVMIRVPYHGTIIKRFVSNGMFVTRGQPLLEFASLKRVRLTAYLPELYAHQASRIQSAAFKLPSGRFQLLKKPHAVGVGIDPATHTLPVLFDVPNPGLLHQQHLDIKVHLSTHQVLAVPKYAVLDDHGASIVFVQTGGESFVKRRVVTGIQDRGWVEIRSGLQQNERIAARGAYEILLSLALNQSKSLDHGHAH